LRDRGLVAVTNAVGVPKERPSITQNDRVVLATSPGGHVGQLKSTAATAAERKTSVSGITIKSADADQGLAKVRFSVPDGLTVDKDRDITGPAAFPEGA
jgi:hypothetical protein